MPNPTATQVKLLFHADFEFWKDSSLSNNLLSYDQETLTYRSSLNTSVQKFGTGCAAIGRKVGVSTYYYNGISTPSSSDWNFDTGDYTIEFWVRFIEIPHGAAGGGSPTMTTTVVASSYDSATPSTNWLFYLEDFATRAYKFEVKDSSGATAFTLTGPGADLAIDTWYHVAVVKEATLWTMYLDGVSKSTSSSFSGSYSANNEPINLGWLHLSQVATYDGLYGYLDEVRISKGVAVYTAAFTPPTAPFEVCTFETTPPNPISSELKLLLHSNGTDGSTTFLDSSVSAHTVTANGNAQIDIAQSKFGGASGLYDGSGDYLSIPTSSDFDLGNAYSGDFTVDFWINLASFPQDTGSEGSPVPDYQAIIGDIDASGGQWSIYLMDNKFTSARSGENQLILEWFDTANSVSRLKTRSIHHLTIGTWSHIAFVRSSGVVKFYVNGIDVGVPTATSGTTWRASTKTLYIASDDFDLTANSLDGWLDEIRIIKGTALYTCDFTPPLAETGTNSITADVTSALWDSTNVLFPVSNAITAETASLLFDSIATGIDTTLTADTTSLTWDAPDLPLHEGFGLESTSALWTCYCLILGIGITIEPSNLYWHSSATKAKYSALAELNPLLWDSTNVSLSYNSILTVGAAEWDSIAVPNIYSFALNSSAAEWDSNIVNLQPTRLYLTSGELLWDSNDVNLTDDIIYVLNATTFGISEYTGIDVYDLITHNSKTFMSNMTKLLENTGDNDEGSNIDCFFTTGYINFHTNMLKRFPTGSVYISYDSDNDGELTFYNSTDGVVDVDYYTVTIDSDYPESFRPQLWDGMKARYWKFKLANTNGSDFKLEDLIINPYPTGRQIK